MKNKDHLNTKGRSKIYHKSENPKNRKKKQILKSEIPTNT